MNAPSQGHATFCVEPRGCPCFKNGKSWKKSFLLIYNTRFTFEKKKLEFPNTEKTCNYFKSGNEKLHLSRFIPDFEKYQIKKNFESVLLSNS
jgi:hypothetical protein